MVDIRYFRKFTGAAESTHSEFDEKNLIFVTTPTGPVSRGGGAAPGGDVSCHHGQ